MNERESWIETDSGFIDARITDDINLMHDGKRRWLEGLQGRRDAVQPEVRREYLPQELKRSPLFMATGMHVSELWLDSQGGAAA